MEKYAPLESSFSSGTGPVLHSQSCNPTELRNVSADERQSIRDTNCGNFQVVRAYCFATNFQAMPNLTVRLRGSIIKGQGNYPLTRSPAHQSLPRHPPRPRSGVKCETCSTGPRPCAPSVLAGFAASQKIHTSAYCVLANFLPIFCPFFFQRPLSSLLSLPRRKRKNADTFPKIPPSRCEAVSAPKPNSEGTSSNPAPLRTLLTARRLQTPPRRLNAHPRRAAASQQLFKKIATRLQRQGRMLPAHD